MRRNGFGTQQLLKGSNRGRDREEQVRADVPPGIDHRYDLTLGVDDHPAQLAEVVVGIIERAQTGQRSVVDSDIGAVAEIDRVEERAAGGGAEGAIGLAGTAVRAGADADG